MSPVGTAYHCQRCESLERLQRKNYYKEFLLQCISFLYKKKRTKPQLTSLSQEVKTLTHNKLNTNSQKKNFHK